MRCHIAFFVCLTAFLSAAQAQTPSLYVSKLSAFVSSNPNVPSFISFHYKDPHPEHKVHVDCVFTTNDTYPSIFFDTWWRCNPSANANADAAFIFHNDSLKLRRSWEEETETGPAFFIGTTNPQLTKWTEAQCEDEQGKSANMTKTLMGTFYSRAAEWEFPIATVVS